MTFEEALHYMEGLIRFGWKLGNERFEALCARFHNPQDRYDIVHVTGTKGKGSTTALCAAILHRAGYRVGSYFSPYVYDVRERVQVNGEPISAEAFARLIAQAKPEIEAIAQTDLGQTTEFELKTLVGFRYFAEQTVDFGCIEVGIGGRLDATNVVKPSVCVITNIGLDHTDRLGDTHAQIAFEKAGILKHAVPAFTHTEHPEALEVIVQTARERCVPLSLVRRGDLSEAQSHNVESPGAVRWQSAGHTAPVTVATARQHYADLPMRMGGLYQRANAACAIAAAEEILAERGRVLDAEAVRQALAETSLPGRLTIVPLDNGPLVVLDGAHNAMAAEALAGPVAALRAEHKIARLFLVVGMLTGHEIEGVLAPFAPEATEVFVCQPEWKRARPAEEVAAVARQFTSAVTIIPSVWEAAQAAVGIARAGDMVLITGSFYTVGEVPPERLRPN